MPLVTTAQFPGLQANVPGSIMQAQQGRLVTQDLRNKERLSLLQQQTEQQKIDAGKVSAQQAIETKSALAKSLGLPDDPATDTQEQARLRVIANNPDQAKKIAEAAGLVDQQRLEEAARFSIQALSIQDPAAQEEFIKQRAVKLKEEGRDPSNTIALLDEPPGEARNQDLRLLQTVALSAKERSDVGQKRQAAEAKIAAANLAEQRQISGERRRSALRAAEPTAAEKNQAKGIKSSPLVVIGAGETSAEKERGKGAAQSLKSVNTEAFSAIKNNRTLDRFTKALDRGASTGFGAGTVLQVKKIADAVGLNFDEEIKNFGFDPSNLTEGQIVQSIGNLLALQLRSVKNGEGLPGATSNRDLEFLLDAVPGLGKTVEGNRSLIKMLKIANGLKLDVAKEAKRLVKANGGKVPLDLESSLVEFANNKSLLTDAERANFEEMSGVSSLPKGVTEDDIKATMKANNLTRQQVLDKLGGQ